MMHDLNNLLMIISAQAELCQKRATSQTLRAAMATITSASRHAIGLTRQITASSSLAATTHAVIDVRPVLEAAMELIEPLLPDTIELRLIFSGDTMHAAVTDLDLVQVIMNLCLNARDAMPDGGVLTIKSENFTRARSGGAPMRYVRIIVQDSGRGMTQEECSWAFAPSYSTKVSAEGAGLGLSIVQQVVLQRGGLVTVSSRLGEGARFEVYFPACAQVDRSASSANPVTSACEWHGLCSALDMDGGIVRHRRQCEQPAAPYASEATSSLEPRCRAR